MKDGHDHEDEPGCPACELESQVIDILEDLQPDPFTVVLVFNRIVSDMLMSIMSGDDGDHEEHAVQ